MKQDAYAMTLLFDYYGELLTEKQKTCFDLYYNQDLSQRDRRGGRDHPAGRTRYTGARGKRPPEHGGQDGLHRPG